MALDQLDDKTEMGFLDHLEELRWHLVRSVIAVFVFALLAYISTDFVWGTVILGPTQPDFWTYRKLCELGEMIGSPQLCIDSIPISFQNREMAGQFMMDIMSSAVIGLILGFPYVFWELWRFIKPGLKSNEKNASRGAVAVVSFLFILGVSFGYFIITPLSINFLANYRLSELIENNIDIKSIVSMLTMLTLACGLMFQLPVVSHFLSKAGLVTPALMKRYRKHALVVILILSAVLTPPDVMSQILIALPITLLYEVSIIVSRRVEKKSQKNQ
ncbi:preprotein translocase subunit TatC [Roseivirga seohaensis subsp. aquiponti]|uniref:Sec-independent protein translocase protein TatC n=1 Tax=Roseivirga seohaensis subsp. aquiponti TaxID=1566026 RepID=A0A0L8AL81_9BACT|nr:twin-arginine translocase subunit TatC [Roseivirga seohaensis]KOF02977.1 preprotein translocase subunit TatC [Roseivirga seohaensis subsp. aquiponti]